METLSKSEAQYACQVLLLYRPVICAESTAVALSGDVYAPSTGNFSAEDASAIGIQFSSIQINRTKDHKYKLFNSSCNDDLDEGKGPSI